MPIVLNNFIYIFTPTKTNNMKKPASLLSEIGTKLFEIANNLEYANALTTEQFSLLVKLTTSINQSAIDINQCVIDHLNTFKKN